MIMPSCLHHNYLNSTPTFPSSKILSPPPVVHSSLPIRTMVIQSCWRTSKHFPHYGNSLNPVVLCGLFACMPHTAQQCCVCKCSHISYKTVTPLSSNNTTSLQSLLFPKVPLSYYSAFPFHWCLSSRVMPSLEQPATGYNHLSTVTMASRKRQPLSRVLLTETPQICQEQVF